MNSLAMANARARSMMAPTRGHLAVLVAAFFVLLVNASSPAVAQQLPQQYFVLTRDEVNTKKRFDAKDALAIIGRDGTTWTQYPHEVERGGRLSPDATKYAWVQHGSPDKPKLTLQILELGRNTPPINVLVDGTVGYCYWSRDVRELVVSMLSFFKDEQTCQTSRVSADGLKTVKLPIPSTEYVRDWSRDGRWLVTTSGRRGPGEKPIPQVHQDVRLMHLDGTGDRIIRRGPGSSNRDRNAGRVTAKSTPLFSPDSQSLLWTEVEAASGDGQPANSNATRIMVQRLTENSPREVTRSVGADRNLAGACWSPDSRSLVLQIQNANRPNRASDVRFEVYDLKGKLIHTLDASRVPQASTAPARRPDRLPLIQLGPCAKGNRQRSLRATIPRIEQHSSHRRPSFSSTRICHKSSVLRPDHSVRGRRPD